MSFMTPSYFNPLSQERGGPFHKGRAQPAHRSFARSHTTKTNVKANPRWKNCFSPVLDRDQTPSSAMFRRLKDFRRVATRYDRNAVNFLVAVCIAATLSYWL